MLSEEPEGNSKVSHSSSSLCHTHVFNFLIKSAKLSNSISKRIWKQIERQHLDALGELRSSDRMNYTQGD